jgi:hypothetical protein
VHEGIKHAEVLGPMASGFDIFVLIFGFQSEFF